MAKKDILNLLYFSAKFSTVLTIAVLLAEYAGNSEKLLAAPPPEKK